jgi:hypothetical protein
MGSIIKWVEGEREEASSISEGVVLFKSSIIS